MIDPPPVRLSSLRLNGGLVSELFAVGGHERLSQIAQPQLAHLGLELAKLPCGDRQQRGRVVRIE